MFPCFCTVASFGLLITWRKFGPSFLSLGCSNTTSRNDSLAGGRSIVRTCPPLFRFIQLYRSPASSQHNYLCILLHHCDYRSCDILRPPTTRRRTRLEQKFSAVDCDGSGCVIRPIPTGTHFTPDLESFRPSLADIRAILFYLAIPMFCG